MHPIIAVVAAAATALVPGTGQAGVPSCTEIGSPPGISVTVAEADAVNVERAVLTASWNSTEYREDVRLRPASTAIGDDCPPSSSLSASSSGPDTPCSATVVPIGELSGFVPLEGLPRSEVSVTVDLIAADGALLFTDATVIHPEPTWPNGQQCPAGGNQALVRVEDGVLS